MNKKMFGPIVLAGGILVSLIGALWVSGALPSQADQPPPPLTDLLLQESDFPGFECERDEQDPGERAKEVAEFVGLSPDYLEGGGVYFFVYSSSEFQAVVHALYRYESEKEAKAHYEHLLQALPLSPLGRGTPILSRSEQSFKGVQGHVVEAQDPIGTAYWFFGTRGQLVTIMVVLSLETKGQPVFNDLLPIVVGRMAEHQ